MSQTTPARTCPRSITHAAENRRGAGSTERRMQLNRTRSLRRIDIDHAPYLAPIWLNPDSRITNSGRQVDPDPQATPSDYDPVRAKSRQRAGPDPRVRFSARASRPAHADRQAQRSRRRRVFSSGVFRKSAHQKAPRRKQPGRVQAQPGRLIHFFWCSGNGVLCSSGEQFNAERYLPAKTGAVRNQIRTSMLGSLTES